MSEKQKLIVEPEGYLIGGMVQMRITLDDGRYIDRQVPEEKVHVTLAAIYQTGVPTEDEKAYPHIKTWITPYMIRSVIVFETAEVYEAYKNYPSTTRHIIERGFVKKVKG